MKKDINTCINAVKSALDELTVYEVTNSPKELKSAFSILEDAPYLRPVVNVPNIPKAHSNIQLSKLYLYQALAKLCPYTYGYRNAYYHLEIALSELLEQ